MGNRLFIGLALLLLVGAGKVAHGTPYEHHLLWKTEGAAAHSTVVESAGWMAYITNVFMSVFPTYTVDSPRWYPPLDKHPLNACGGLTDESWRLISDNPRASEPPIELVILSSHHANAYALPADHSRGREATIYLSVGLLQLIHTDGELAFVLAHEMAHITSDLFTAPFEDILLTPSVLQHISEVHLEWEHSADAYALQMVRKAGFSTSHSVQLLERLQLVEKNSKHHFLRSHPSLKERVAALSVSLEQRTPRYRF